MNMLELDKVTIGYADKIILQEADMSLSKGEIAGVVGPNGSGKTTLLTAILGIHKQTSGHIYLEKHKLDKLTIYDRGKEGILFVPQSLHQFWMAWHPRFCGFIPGLTVRENVCDVVQPERRALEWLEAADLSDFAGHDPACMSWGQQQRLATIRMCALRPKLLLLDEPFTATDWQIKKEFKQSILRHLKKHKISALYTASDPKAAEGFCDRVLLIRNKRIIRKSAAAAKTSIPGIKQGSYQQVKNAPEAGAHLRREDIRHLSSYVDIVNRLLTIVIPVVGINPCRSALSGIRNTYEILQGAAITDEGALVCPKAVAVLAGHSEYVGLSIVIGPFNILITQLIELYSAMSSSQLGIAAVISAASGASREKLRVIENLKAKLEQKVLERTENLRQANAYLEEAYEKLKLTQEQLIRAEKLEAVGRMASGVAHEVKNPLAIILQGVDYLESQLPEGQKDDTEMLSMMRDNVKRADEIVRGLLDFSKTENLKPALEDINKVIMGTLALIRPQTKHSSVKIVKQLQKDLPKLRIDKGKIEQVFVNLLLNAFYAMPQGGTLYLRTFIAPVSALEEKVGYRRTDLFVPNEQVVIIEIEDTGPGVTNENMRKIFDPFFTTKNRTEGSGMGLAVTKSIIELHKGIITAEKDRKQGAKFLIALKPPAANT